MIQLYPTEAKISLVRSRLVIIITQYKRTTPKQDELETHRLSTLATMHIQEVKYKARINEIECPHRHKHWDVSREPEKLCSDNAAGK